MSVLVVDDNPDYRYLVGRRLRETGLWVHEARDGDTALAVLDRGSPGGSRAAGESGSPGQPGEPGALGGRGEQGAPGGRGEQGAPGGRGEQGAPGGPAIEVVLLDYDLPGRDGIETLRAIRGRDDPPAVVIVTGMGSESVAIEAMRAGAADYVTKDTAYLTALPKIVERVLRVRDLERREATQRELERALAAERAETFELRRQLVTWVTHEVRTPLTAIVGFSSTLLHHWDRLGEGERRDLVTRIHANSQDLGDLLERLVDLSSAESGRTAADRARLVLADVVDAAVSGLATLVQARAVRVEIDRSLVVWADPTLLRRTLWTLLTHADRIAAPSTAIVVGAAALPGGGAGGAGGAGRGGEAGEGGGGAGGAGEGGGRAGGAGEGGGRAGGAGGGSVRVEVRDTGEGADADVIGLALVRDHVRLMSGEAGVEAEPGRGLAFWFTLPAG